MRRKRTRRTLTLWCLAGLIGAAPALLAQAKPGQGGDSTGRVTYESIAPGVVAAHVFSSDALRDVTVAVEDVILGPGKSAADLRVRDVGLMELKSGAVETTIDGQTVHRRPGDYWVVRSNQRYSIKNLGGQVVIQMFTLALKKK